MRAWQIEFEGNIWREESLTAAEAVDVARLVGGGWETVHPLHSPEATVAIVATLCCTRLGEDLQDAIERVQGLPAAYLLGCVSVHEPDGPTDSQVVQPAA